MNISEDELRAMVRNAISGQSDAPAQPSSAPRPIVLVPHSFSEGGVHASHGLIFTSSGGGDEEGRCLIEPGVACTHCGYCQSLGH